MDKVEGEGTDGEQENHLRRKPTRASERVVGKAPSRGTARRQRKGKDSPAQASKPTAGKSGLPIKETGKNGKQIEDGVSWQQGDMAEESGEIGKTQMTPRQHSNHILTEEEHGKDSEKDTDSQSVEHDPVTPESVEHERPDHGDQSSMTAADAEPEEPLSKVSTTQKQNVKMGRDASSSMMSELLKKMAKDHEEKNSRRQMAGESAGSPASSTASSEDTGSKLLLNLLQQQQSKFSKKLHRAGGNTTEDKGLQKSTTAATGSSSASGDLDLSSVIANVDRSGSFLMHLLTSNQQQSLHTHPGAGGSTEDAGTLKIASSSSLDVASDVEDHDGDSQDNVLVIQPEGSHDTHTYQCPICGARFERLEDRAFHFQVDHKDLELIGEDSSQQEYIALEELKALAAPKPATRTRKRKASHTHKVVDNVESLGSEDGESPMAKRLSSQESYHNKLASPALDEDDEDIGFVQGYLCKTCGMLRKTLQELREHKAAVHPDLEKPETSTDELGAKKMTADKHHNRYAIETCLICGISSQELNLKNIYRTAERYDLLLMRLLDRTIKVSLGHSRFICITCKRQIRKLEGADKIKQQLQDMFDRTNSSGSQPERAATDREASSGSRRGRKASGPVTGGPARGRGRPPRCKAKPTESPQGGREREDAGRSCSGEGELPQDVRSLLNGLASENPPILEEVSARASPVSTFTSPNLALRSLLSDRAGLNPTILKVPEPPSKPLRVLSIKSEPMDETLPCHSSTPNDAEDDDENDDDTATDRTFVPPKSSTPGSATSSRRRSKRTPKRVDSPPPAASGSKGEEEPPASTRHSILGEILALGAATSTAYASPPAASSSRGSSALVKSEPDSALSEPYLSSLITQAVERVQSAVNLQPSMQQPGFIMVPCENPNVPMFQCLLCQQVFYTKEAINVHVSCHVQGSPDFKCFKCGFFNQKLPSQWRIMQGHLLTHRIPPHIFNKFPCPTPGCKQLFRGDNERADHMVKAHQSKGPGPALSTAVMLHQGLTGARGHGLSPNGLFDFTCPLCNNSLQTIEALDVHVKCHGSSGNFTSRSYQCYLCGYCHPTQPGSWRFMRGHLTKFHVPEPIPNEWFLYYECSRYTCRIKFASSAARDLHETCHDESQDGHFRCHWCGYKPYDTPFLWEPMKNHIIKYHPMVFSAFNMECLCGASFHGYNTFADHIDQHAY